MGPLNYVKKDILGRKMQQKRLISDFRRPFSYCIQCVKEKEEGAIFKQLWVLINSIFVHRYHEEVESEQQAQRQRVVREVGKKGWRSQKE